MTVDIDFGRIAQFGVVAPSFNGPDGPLITAGLLAASEENGVRLLHGVLPSIHDGEDATVV